MAKKRKSRSTAGVGHLAIRRIAEPVNPFERQRNRYTPKCLTLAIMGGAAFFLLKGCGDGGNTDNDGDGTFYSTVNDCIDDGNSASVCADGWNNAKTEFYANVPKQLTQERCQSQFGDCYFDSTDRSWVPVLSGFLLSRAIRQNRDEQYIYSSGGSSYASRPVPSGAPRPATMRGAAAQGKAIPLPAMVIRRGKLPPSPAAAMAVLPAPAGTGEVNHATTQRTGTPGSG